MAATTPPTSSPTQSSTVSTTASTPPTPEQVAQCHAAKLRVVRRALKPNVGTGHVASVTGHQVTSEKEASIRPNQSLQPLQIARHYFLYLDQASDPDAHPKLAAYSGAEMAYAEDLVCLYGPGALSHLERLQIAFDKYELEQQTSLLEKGQGHCEEGRILLSIVEGITILMSRGYQGEYYAIVSPALYEEAHRNRATLMDAPIYQIQPLLKGFLCSEAAEGRTGVIFSLARGTISLQVPVDLCLDSSLPPDGSGRPRFRLTQQFRLVIDDPGARTPLK
jgi:Encapsulating protein for peroxidase